jgi:hypothetical protein
MSAGVVREAMRTKPMKNSPMSLGKSSIEDLNKAYNKRTKAISSDGTSHQPEIQPVIPPTIDEMKALLQSGNPEDAQIVARSMNPAIYAGNMSRYAPTKGAPTDYMNDPRIGSKIFTNPNLDEAYLAHELGHSASAQTKVGDKVRRIRDAMSANPKLAMALAGAAGLTPIAAAAMTPGDDDLDEAILGSLALSSPILIDEALASKNGLAIMKEAGRPATTAQKARLAGGYLSYLAAPITTAVVANTLGNQLD